MDVEIEDVECVAETEAAILLDTGQWVPKSVIGEDSEVTERGDRGSLWVKEWFAVKEGLV